MLELRSASKSFTEKKRATPILRDVSITLPGKGLVFVVGSSGSGKTTLLNILGGMSQIDSGEFIVNGQSSAKFRESQWNAYRSTQVGMVFQNCAMIPYRSVLDNLVVACELAGFAGEEAKANARQALETLGVAYLEDKLPDQISKGEAQAVAIARAISVDPDILLADEPLAFMDREERAAALAVLECQARERLVVITARELPGVFGEGRAENVIELSGGRVVANTVGLGVAPAAAHAAAAAAPAASAPAGAHATPAHAAAAAAPAASAPAGAHAAAAHARRDFQEKARQRRRRGFTMGKAWAISLLKMKNKSSRGLATGIAGALGIIGIALVLSLTTGVQNYVEKIESATLNAFPLEFSGTGYDTSYNLATTSLEDSQGSEVSGLLAMVEESGNNDLKSLKAYFESGTSGIEDQAKAIEYSYNVTPQFYQTDTSDGAKALSPNSMLSLYATLSSLSEQASASLSLSGEVFHAMPESPALYEDTYTVLEGRWPQNEKECVVVLDKDGLITDQILFSLGLLDNSVLKSAVKDLITGKEGALNAHCEGVTYADLLNVKLKLLCSAEYYQRDTVYGGWKDMSSNESYLTSLVENAEEVSVVGVVKPNSGQGLPTLDTGINYPVSLQGYVANKAAQTEIVQEQLANPEVDVLSGLTFEELADTDISTRLEEFLGSVGTIGDQKVSDVTGIIDLTMDSIGEALGLAQNLVDEIKGIDVSKISINMPEIIAGLQEKGYEFPEYPKPTQEDFDAAGITGVTEQTKQDMAEAMRVLVMNEESKFPYQMAMIDATTLTERFATWLQSGTVTIKIDDVDTGKTPIEFARTVLQESLGKAVTAAQTAQFLASYVVSTFPDYVKANVDVVKQILTDAVTAEINKVLDPEVLAAIKANVGDIKVNLDDLLDLETLSSDLTYLVGALLKANGSSAEENLSKFGYALEDNPAHIYVYPKDLDGKDGVKEIIAKYNTQVEAAGTPEKTIVYVDPIGAVSDGIVGVVRVIGLLPILLIGVSVIVCAVMVGVATRLSARLRRQEFAVMRAMGASQGDVRRLILAEAGMQGLIAGVIGVVVVWVLCLVANAAIHGMLGIAGLVELPLLTALILILVNVALTAIAGFGPAVSGSREPIAKGIGC